MCAVRGLSTCRAGADACFVGSAFSRSERHLFFHSTRPSLSLRRLGTVFFIHHSELMIILSPPFYPRSASLIAETETASAPAPHTSQRARRIRHPRQPRVMLSALQQL